METKTRRLYLSSFPSLTQQEHYDSVYSKVDVNCRLNGMWCPSICDTKEDLLDRDGYSIRTPP